MFNIVDLIIVIFILFGFLIGYRRGVIKQGVMTIGLVVSLIFAFYLKNPISDYMYKHFPFFEFDLIIKNASVLNILLYETIAFLIAFSLLEIILIVLIKVSNIAEVILKMTVILKYPSKILGAFLGGIEYYLLAFIILLIISQPTFNFSNSELIRTSKLKEIVITNSTILSVEAKSLVDTFDETNDLIKNSKDMPSKKFNCEAMKIMIDKKIIEKKSAKYLYDSKKIDTKCGIE